MDFSAVVSPKGFRSASRTSRTRPFRFRRSARNRPIYCRVSTLTGGGGFRRRTGTNHFFRVRPLLPRWHGPVRQGRTHGPSKTGKKQLEEQPPPIARYIFRPGSSWVAFYPRLFPKIKSRISIYCCFHSSTCHYFSLMCCCFFFFLSVILDFVKKIYLLLHYILL